MMLMFNNCIGMQTDPLIYTRITMTTTQKTAFRAYEDNIAKKA